MSSHPSRQKAARDVSEAVVRLGFISLEAGQDPFYPPWLRALRGKPGGELLPFYASRLGTIEMTSVNYRIPTELEAKRWADSVPSGFSMHIKLFGLFSYGSCPISSLPPSVIAILKQQPGSNQTCKLKTMKPQAVAETWRCFRLALSPLREQAKLGLVMSQFTAGFVPNEDNYQRLRDICSQIAPTRLAAEFRSPTWSQDPVAATVLQELNIVCVLTDDNGSYNENNNFRDIEKQLKGNDIGYCRIHRRPVNQASGLICENVTQQDIEISMQVDLETGLSKGDLRSYEVDEWSQLLHKAAAVMKPGGCIYVLFSTIGRNASADNVDRFQEALGDLASPWPQNSVVSIGADEAVVSGYSTGCQGEEALSFDGSTDHRCGARKNRWGRHRSVTMVQNSG